VDHALRAVLAVIADPNVTQCDPLLDLSAVARLDSKDSKQTHRDAYRLLQIFSGLSVADYLQFIEQHPTALATLGLNEAAALAKIRRLTFVSLAASKDVLSYAEVQRALILANNDEVEESLIDAVSFSCMDAKLDQEHETVIVRRVNQRGFAGDKAAWSLLGRRIDNWSKGIDHALDSLPQEDNYDNFDESMLDEARD